MSVTTLYGIGNWQYRTEAQGGVYENWSYTSPLQWHRAYSAPTPTGVALVQPTESVALPHTLFTGFSDGYWVHRVFRDGHLTGTYTFVDQHFALPIQYDYVQSVALPVSPAAAGVAGEDPCVPSPAGAAVLVCAAVFSRFRGRRG